MTDPTTLPPSSPVALLDQLDAAREAAYDEVVRLCRGGDNRWTMSIPARPTVDSDLLIAKALDDHEQLTAAVRAVLELCNTAERDVSELLGLRAGLRIASNVGSDDIRAAITAALSVTP